MGAGRWQKLSYVPISQASKDEKEQDRYYGFEIGHRVSYGGKSFPTRIIFILSDGKLKRDKKSHEKKLSRIEGGLKDIQSKIGKPHYSREDLIRKKIEKLLGKYPKYGEIFEVEVLNEDGRAKGLSFSIDEDKLKEIESLHGVYALVTSLSLKTHPLDTVFSLFKEQHVSESANRTLKGPIRLRPIFLHQQRRIESLLFVIFLALMAYYLLERLYRVNTKDPRKSRTTARTILWKFYLYSIAIISLGMEQVVKASELDSDQEDILKTLGFPSPNDWLSS